ncbi:MAG TPA: hypothetical protein PLI18_06300, partial [Pirellulaceae bacterium]|nr:hypothetical protein [Pirellulaceae bacterium]
MTGGAGKGAAPFRVGGRRSIVADRAASCSVPSSLVDGKIESSTASGRLTADAARFRGARKKA